MDPLTVALIGIGATILGAVLSKVAEIAINNYRKARVSRVSLKRAGWAEVVSWNWDGRKLLKQLIHLDHQLIGDDLTERREGTVEQWAPVFTHHPDTWALLVAQPKEIVGYWHFAPLTLEEFARAKSGALLDSEVTNEVIMSVDMPGIHNAYFTMMGASPDFPGVGARLTNLFFERLSELADRGVYFREFCANAFTKKGAELCEGFGMSKVGAHADFGTVYAINLVPWPDKLRHRRWKQLAEQYDALAVRQSKALAKSNVGSVD